MKNTESTSSCHYRLLVSQVVCNFSSENRVCIAFKVYAPPFRVFAEQQTKRRKKKIKMCVNRLDPSAIANDVNWLVQSAVDGRDAIVLPITQFSIIIINSIWRVLSILSMNKLKSISFHAPHELFISIHFSFFFFALCLRSDCKIRTNASLIENCAERTSNTCLCMIIILMQTMRSKNTEEKNW